MALKRKRDVLTEKTRSLSDLIDLLKSQPLPVAHEAIERIRRGLSPEEVLNSITADPSRLGRPSALAVNRSLLPHTQSKFEFELNARHPIAYPSLRPIANVDFRLIGFTPSSNKLQGLIGGAVALGSLTRWTPPAKAQTVDPTQLFHARSSRLTENYIDDRLAKIDFSLWTAVPVSNEFAAKVLSLYLEVFHPFLGLFDADLFLDGLISGDTRFCSRMMVCSILAWTCVSFFFFLSPLTKKPSYAHYNPSATVLSTRFLDEAVLLYEQDRMMDTLPAMVGIMLISLIWIVRGNDKHGVGMLKECADMGGRLQLYKPILDCVPPLNIMDPDVRTAAAHTAWGTFNWQMQGRHP
jgi:hypothetical protein